LERKEMPPLNMPRIRKNPLVEIIPISRGCLSACSFCITKQARGNLCSYSIEDIVHAALKAVTHGAKEIWLTAQDTTCYGFDIGTNLARLLRELVKIPGKFKIRVGMGSPKHLLKFKDELIPLFLEKKIFRFIHLPVQSGSDKVLQEMKRGNSKEEFISLIKELREAVPRLTVATDMIVGFPGESEEDFQETLELVKKVTPDVINISRFWPRPGTAAAKKKQVDVEVVKKRSSLLMDIFKNISRMQNELWIGWEGGILIDEKGKFEKQWSGRNLSYKPVIVEGDYKLGDVVRVKIEVAGVFDLRGKVVGSSH